MSALSYVKLTECGVGVQYVDMLDFSVRSVDVRSGGAHGWAWRLV
jgi:hypothetical protein